MKITVLVNDGYPGNVNPLIYTVTVNDPTSEQEVIDAVIKERIADIGDDVELDLTLLVAFEGDLTPIADWRD